VAAPLETHTTKGEEFRQVLKTAEKRNFSREECEVQWRIEGKCGVTELTGWDREVERDSGNDEGTLPSRH
jgi:hypothetical protein